jgi:hypothetical protein
MLNLKKSIRRIIISKLTLWLVNFYLYSIVSVKEKFEENEELKELEVKKVHTVELNEIKFEDKLIGMK